MRKPLICAVAPLLAAATVSCSMISGYSTDEAASYARAVELVKTNVDTDKFKIYSIDFFEREALSDDLFLVSVKMVNRDDRAFSQTYYLNGLEPTDLDDVSFDAPKYETTAGIDPGTIDPEEIAAQIAALNGGGRSLGQRLSQQGQRVRRTDRLVRRPLHRGRQGDRIERRQDLLYLLRSAGHRRRGRTALYRSEINPHNVPNP